MLLLCHLLFAGCWLLIAGCCSKLLAFIWEDLANSPGYHTFLLELHVYL
jgi:hypothetical protein